MQSEKTPEELISELEKHPFALTLRERCLRYATTLENDNLNQLLDRAEKIEAWLKKGQSHS